MDYAISKLIDIKEDVDAIAHHQSDRIVSDLDEVIKYLMKSSTRPNSNSCEAPKDDMSPELLNQISYS